MEALKDNTTIIDQLNRYQSFHSMEIGTCFTIRSFDLDKNRVLINIEGGTTEQYYFIPFVLKRLITNDLFEKICTEELKPIVEYRGMVKHKKIEGIKYHNFKIVKILPINISRNIGKGRKEERVEDKKPFTCEICLKSFNRKDSVQRHISEVHHGKHRNIHITQIYLYISGVIRPQALHTHI